MLIDQKPVKINIGNKNSFFIVRNIIDAKVLPKKQKCIIIQIMKHDKIFIGLSIRFDIYVGFFLVQLITIDQIKIIEHPVRVSAQVINETFGGSQNISILVEGDILDPEVMGQIDRYETALKRHPAVGNVMSIAGIVREISKALNDEGDPYYNMVPHERNALAQYLELFMMSGDPEDLERLVDF